MKLSPKAQASLDKVVEKFQSGDLSDIVKIAAIRRDPRDLPTPFDKWSLCNQVLAYAQSGSLDLRGYRQWQAAGRQVKKGTAGAFILVPVFMKKGEKEEDKIKFFKTVSVHPVENTEGDPLPEFDYAPANLPPLSEIADRLNIKTAWRPLPIDRLGQWNATRNQIDVGSPDTAIFFHELAHAIHTRIDGQKGKKGQDAGRETVADFTACVLMQLYGLGDRSGNTWKYISHYNKDPLKAITKALSVVEKVLLFLETMQ